MTQDTNGIWQFDREEKTTINSGRSISSASAFVYENESLVINLPSLGKVAGLPADNIYRIKTRWKGDDLYIFPPLGNKWEVFATWNNNRFVMVGDGKMKIFKKIKPEEIVQRQKDLLKPGRELWPYPYLNPDDVEL